MRSRPPLLLWSSGVAAAALFIVMQFMLAGLEPNILALQWSFTPASFQSVLAAWQAPGVAAYRRHFPVDFVFLLSYGVFGYLLAARTHVFSGMGTTWSARVRWLAPAAALCDAGENLAHLYLLSSPAGMQAPVVALSASLSVLKWLLLAAFTGIAGRALFRRKR